VLTGSPRNNTHCSDRKKEDMVDDNRICREGGEGDEPSAGGSRGRRRGRGRSSGRSLDGTRGARGGGAAAPPTTAAGVSEITDGIELMLGIMERGWSIL
jgi:hypothetical protein